MCGNCLSSQAVNCAVVPEPSERTTGMIVRVGSLRPLLSFVIAGSFQLVILLVKILAIVSPDSRRFLDQLAADLQLVGERRATGDDRHVGELAPVAVSPLPNSSLPWYGISVMPKSVTFCAKSLRPCDEPAPL